jgi:hypothetical protein
MLTMVVVIVSTTVGAQDGFQVYEYEGYTDTPLIPGSTFRVHERDRPQPPRVEPPPAPPEPAAPPSDAIVLFDGSSTDHFTGAEWEVRDGALVAGEGNLQTRDAFGDCQLHIEWRAPDPPSGAPVNMGNSGVFMMGLYEIQVYDSYSSRIYADGSAAAIYGQTPPLVNASRRPGEWQTFDIIFTAPVFVDGQLMSPGAVTILHNGVLVQRDTQLLGATTHRAAPSYTPHAARLPIMLQGHGSPVEYRNLWLRDLQPTG